MKDYDLSVLIPARNEQFLKQTVEDILAHKEGKTEIIVGLDGEWANPPLSEHPDLNVLYVPLSIGQRAITNQLCRLSTAKYIMKIDAHCAVDQGFDVKMLESMQGHDNWTMIPMTYNFHVFDWVCQKCGERTYQGPTPEKCLKCGGEMRREMIWQRRESKWNTAYRFDREMHFQYWGDYKRRQEGDIVDTMSAQGSCFMLTREKYWELDICDEKHGGWGQQGTEVACKTWLSGGELKVNKKTWYAHMFRTQGGDFGFPYPLSGNAVDKARAYSKDMWLNDKWPKAIHPLSWLIEKFSPVPDWDVPIQEKNINVVRHAKPSKQVIYYTHCAESTKPIYAACRTQLLKGIKEKHIISVSDAPLNFGVKNIVFPRIPESGFSDMFGKIYLGLQAATADYIFLCEHDVLYHPSHFDFIPPKDDVYYYNENVWHIRAEDGFCLFHVNRILSCICARREFLFDHFKKRIAKVYKNGFSYRMGFEPGTHNRPERIDDFKSDAWKAEFPNIDVRLGTNATKSKWTKEEFRSQRFTEGWTETWEVPGWGNGKLLMDKINSGSF